MAEKSEWSSRDYSYCRKQKSLGLLCSNFVALCNREDVETVGLDDAAVKLGVERRRIYDIVNVMESVGVLTKKAKNRYLWIGLKGIPAALEQLKMETLKELNGLSWEPSVERTSIGEDEDKSLDQNGEDGEGRPCTNDTTAKSKTVLDRKEKSLGQLTQNFVKLLLTTNADTVSLDEAARLLLGDDQNPSHMRKCNAAKVRRLYDIANVLSSLNLIEKTHQCDTRKPAFRWLGTKGKHDTTVSTALPPATQQLGRRMFGTELTNVDVKRSRIASSIDKKPFKTEMPNRVIKECNFAAQRQLQFSKPFVFGPFSPSEVVSQQKEGKVQDFESLTSSLRPTYHSQALHGLFTHYMEAYNSWFAQIAGGSCNIQQPCKKSSPFWHI